MIERFAAWLRRVSGERDHDRGVAAERHELAVLRRDAADPAFSREQRRLATSSQQSLVLGEVLREGSAGEEFRVEARDLLSAHASVTGASGAGKTFLVLLMLLELLRSGLRGVVLLDMKGEVSDLLLRSFLPAWIGGVGQVERDAVLRDLVVLDPFAPDALPPLNVLRRDPQVAIEVQAFDLASSFERAVGAEMGIRQDTILDWNLRLAVDQGLSFVGLRRMMEEPFLLEALVARTQDRDIKRYFLTRYASEPQTSKLSLLARLDRFLALPSTRLSLSAPGCVDFDRMLSGGISIINLGGAPAGCEDVAKFWATILLTKIIRAIFRRDPSGKAPPALLVADEWQEALTRPMAEQFERVLTLARSRNVFCWLVNQQLGQVQKASPSLREILVGNTAIQVLFRASPEDARAMRHLLPVGGREARAAPLPWERATGGPFLSAAEELEARVSEVAQMPERVAYFWDRRKPWRAVRFRTATLAQPDLRALPRDLVDRVVCGSVAIPVVDLETAARAEADALDALARLGGAAAPPAVAGGPAKPARRRKRNPKLPNLG